VGAYVLLPTLAHISRQARGLSTVVRRVYGISLAGAVPVSAATIPLGVPIAVLFLGQQWRPAGHAIAALWGLLLGGALASVAAETSKAIGKPELLVRIHGLNLAVTAVLVIATAIPFGLVGVATAVSVSQVLVGLYAFGLLAPHVGMTWRDLLAEAFSPLIASAALVAVMVAFALVTHPLDHGVALGFLLTGVQVVLGAAVYLAALGFIDPRRRGDLRAMGRRLRRTTGPGYA
jgi:PST family polysaccharide transporter